MKHRFGKWLITIVSGLIGGGIIGTVLELIVEKISYYEMHAPGELTYHTLLIALPLSCIAGVFVSWAKSSTSVLSISGRIAALTTMSLAGGILCASLSAAIVKLNLVAPLELHTSVPIPRVWFCYALTRGVVFFTLMGFVWFVKRETRAV